MGEVNEGVNEGVNEVRWVKAYVFLPGSRVVWWGG